MATTLTGRTWREQPQRYRLIGNRDKETGQVYFPPRKVAPGNMNAQFEEVQLNPKGKVLTYTIIRVAPTQYGDLAPYALALVENEDGVRVFAQITDMDAEDVKIGMKVELEFRRLYDDN
ncbi:MAG: Zn-ribbon domain-containing OB-fold protein, partial [Chloroflexota bacterium]